jgi:hypothetical protein
MLLVISGPSGAPEGGEQGGTPMETVDVDTSGGKVQPPVGTPSNVYPDASYEQGPVQYTPERARPNTHDFN